MQQQFQAAVIDDVELSRPQRLVKLIEARQVFIQNYAVNYGQASTALEIARDPDEPSMAGLSEQQRAALVADLEQLRNDTARWYVSTIQLVENTINELLPGAFPRDGIQVLSDEWTLEERKEFLRDLANASLGLAGVAAVAGAAPVAAALGGFGAGIYGGLAAGNAAGLW